MRAAMLYGPGDIRFEEVPDPRITKPSDGIVKVIASCICGSDLWGYRGDNGPIEEPATIGHECLGEVVAVGSEVRTFAVGDTVIVPFDHCDNTCAHCATGNQQACVNLGFTTSGQGEYALVTEIDGSCVKIDPPSSEQLPSLLTLADVMATGWHAAVAAGVKPGGTAVVVGDGAVGLLGVLSAATMGAEKVIALSRHEPRQKVATAFGATHLIAERGDEATNAVLELTDGLGADAVLECVGTEQSMSTAFAVARPGATVGFVGVPHGVKLPVRRMFTHNIGLAGGMAPVRTYLPDLLARVQSGAINPGLVFDLALPLERVAEGYTAMADRTAIKVQLVH